MKQSQGKIPPQLKRFVQYTAVGSFSFSFDLILLYFLTDFIGVHYLASATFAFILTNSVNYALNRSWGFRKTKQSLTRGYVYLMTISFISLVLIIALMAMLVEIFLFNYLIARILIGILIGILNFTLNSKITFKTPIFRK